MQQALKDYQESTDTVSEDICVSKRLLEHRTIKHVSMLVTMSQMLQDIGNLQEARGHLEDALQRLRQSFLPQNLLEAQDPLHPWDSLSQVSNSSYNRTQPICCPPLSMVLQVQSSQATEYCPWHNEEDSQYSS